jgi:hypothetical protein
MHVDGFARAAMHAMLIRKYCACGLVGIMRGVRNLLVISVLYARDVLAQKCSASPKPLQPYLLDSTDEQYTSCSLALSIRGGARIPARILRNAR